MLTKCLYDFPTSTIQGESFDMQALRGKVVLIVNTASACGFTPQLQGLQQLYSTYESQGLVVLGFPCNQFGQQEKGDAHSIAQFCQLNYGVEFPMMAKIDVNGPAADPLYVWLKQQAPGFLGTRSIKWNFTKFLVGRHGQVIQRFAPRTSPQALVPAIEQALRDAR